ncbi:MAG: Bax inhibitor-1 family protein [Coprobacillus sp.]|nr:Bax inhibitor-1 family protein [Coprobacillus sp.]
MPDYNDYRNVSDLDGDQVVVDEGHEYRGSKRRAESGTLNMARTYGYMCFLILLTAAIALLLGYAFYVWMGNNYSAANTGIMVTLVVSCVAQLVLCIAMSMSGARKGMSKRTTFMAVLYAVIMGVMMSSFTLWIDWEILGLTFAVTGLAFGGMALVGTIAKRNLRMVASIGSGLIVGALFISLFSLIFMFFAPGLLTMTYYLVIIIMFIAMLLITAVDVRRIRNIASEDNYSRDVCFYCAFRLYTDYIVIFIYALRLIMRFGGRR